MGHGGKRSLELQRPRVPAKETLPGGPAQSPGAAEPQAARVTGQ